MNIKDAAERVGLTESTIRYYEEIGIIKPIRRSSVGIREFDEVNIRCLKFAKTMRAAGLPVRTLQNYIDFIVEDDDASLPARKSLLEKEAEKIHDNIERLQAAYTILEREISNDESSIQQAARDCRDD